MEPKKQTVYRPAVSRVTAEQMAGKLRAMEASFRTRWTALIALGAIVTMLGPVLIATLIWFWQFFSSRRAGPPQTWMIVFFQVSAVMLPLLFLFEWLTRGKMMEKTAETVGGMGAAARFTPGVGRGIAVIAFLEMCLWGPRMVIGGSKKIFGQSAHAGADRNLAARMLHALYIKEGGVPTAQLYPLAGGHDAAFSDALAYLIFFDLIAISKAGDRAWMLGDAKRDLKLETK